MYVVLSTAIIHRIECYLFGCVHYRLSGVLHRGPAGLHVVLWPFGTVNRGFVFCVTTDGLKKSAAPLNAIPSGLNFTGKVPLPKVMRGDERGGEGQDWGDGDEKGDG